MKKRINIVWALALVVLASAQTLPAAEHLKVHGIFRSNMVLQRDKPITIWGQAPPGTEVTVSLGERSGAARASGEKGALGSRLRGPGCQREAANAHVKAGGEVVRMDNIVVGDIWVMNTSCKPAFYRILMKLMVEGWREDFKDSHLPVAIIGLCAGGQAQTRLNFEQQGLSTGAYIREAQRLGLADAGDPDHTVFIPWQQLVRRVSKEG